MGKPIPVTIENGPEKIPGFIMKITPTGVMIELDKITFKVGSFFTIQFQFDEGGAVIIERVRSIKHYDQYYRTPPKKSYAEGETPPTPKKLCEAHFQMLSETNKILITKYLLVLQQQAQLQSKTQKNQTSALPKMQKQNK